MKKDVIILEHLDLSKSKKSRKLPYWVIPLTIYVASLIVLPFVGSGLRALIAAAMFSGIAFGVLISVSFYEIFLKK